MSANVSSKLDTHLLELAGKAGQRGRLYVVITVRPGTRAAVRLKVQRQGARAGGNFAGVEAFAAGVPARLLRDLALDPDIVNISSDADLMTWAIAT